MKISLLLLSIIAIILCLTACSSHKVERADNSAEQPADEPSAIEEIEENVVIEENKFKLVEESFIPVL